MEIDKIALISFSGSGISLIESSGEYGISGGYSDKVEKFVDKVKEVPLQQIAEFILIAQGYPQEVKNFKNCFNQVLNRLLKDSSSDNIAQEEDNDKLLLLANCLEGFYFQKKTNAIKEFIDKEIKSEKKRRIETHLGNLYEKIIEHIIKGKFSYQRQKIRWGAIKITNGEIKPEGEESLNLLKQKFYEKYYQQIEVEIAIPLGRKSKIYSLINNNFYGTLGILANSSPHEIQRAYHEIARKYHSDSQSWAEAEDEENATINKLNREAKMREINFAFSILSDPIRKRKYDSVQRIKTQFEQMKNWLEGGEWVVELIVDVEEITNNIFNFDQEVKITDLLEKIGKKDIVTYILDKAGKTTIENEEKWNWLPEKTISQIKKNYFQEIENYISQTKEQKGVEKLKRLKVISGYLINFSSIVGKGWDKKKRLIWRKIFQDCLIHIKNESIFLSIETSPEKTLVLLLAKNFLKKEKSLSYKLFTQLDEKFDNFEKVRVFFYQWEKWIREEYYKELLFREEEPSNWSKTLTDLKEPNDELVKDEILAKMLSSFLVLREDEKDFVEEIHNFLDSHQKEEDIDLKSLVLQDCEGQEKRLLWKKKFTNVFLIKELWKTMNKYCPDNNYKAQLLREVKFDELLFKISDGGTLVSFVREIILEFLKENNIPITEKLEKILDNEESKEEKIKSLENLLIDVYEVNITISQRLGEITPSLAGIEKLHSKLIEENSSLLEKTASLISCWNFTEEYGDVLEEKFHHWTDCEKWLNEFLIPKKKISVLKITGKNSSSYFNALSSFLGGSEGELAVELRTQIVLQIMSDYQFYPDYRGIENFCSLKDEQGLTDLEKLSTGKWVNDPFIVFSATSSFLKRPLTTVEVKGKKKLASKLFLPVSLSTLTYYEPLNLILPEDKNLGFGLALDPDLALTTETYFLAEEDSQVKETAWSNFIAEKNKITDIIKNIQEAILVDDLRPEGAIAKSIAQINDNYLLGYQNKKWCKNYLEKEYQESKERDGEVTIYSLVNIVEELEWKFETNKPYSKWEIGELCSSIKNIEKLLEKPKAAPTQPENYPPAKFTQGDFTLRLEKLQKYRRHYDIFRQITTAKNEENLKKISIEEMDEKYQKCAQELKDLCVNNLFPIEKILENYKNSEDKKIKGKTDRPTITKYLVEICAGIASLNNNRQTINESDMVQQVFSVSIGEELLEDLKKAKNRILERAVNIWKPNVKETGVNESELTEQLKNEFPGIGEWSDLILNLKNINDQKIYQIEEKIASVEDKITKAIEEIKGKEKKPDNLSSESVKRVSWGKNETKSFEKNSRLGKTRPTSLITTPLAQDKNFQKITEENSGGEPWEEEDRKLINEFLREIEKKVEKKEILLDKDKDIEKARTMQKILTETRKAQKMDRQTSQGELKEQGEKLKQYQVENPEICKKITYFSGAINHLGKLLNTKNEQENERPPVQPPQPQQPRPNTQAFPNKNFWLGVTIVVLLTSVIGGGTLLTKKFFPRRGKITK